MNLTEKLYEDREAFLRDMGMLLRDFSREWVAYKGGKLIDHSSDYNELIKRLRGLKYDKEHPGVYVELVNESAFFQGPLICDVPGVVEGEISN